MKVYVIVKGALAELGESMWVSVEAVFDSEEKAKSFLQGKQTVWMETVQSTLCYCERSVQIIEVQ